MYAGVNDFSNLPSATHVKIEGAMKYAAIFPAYSVGVGTTAAGLPAGVPTLVFLGMSDRQMRGAFISRAKAGAAGWF